MTERSIHVIKETNQKQYLTEEVLKECWDADKRPGGDLPNRTFDNRNDLLDLYEASHFNERWPDLYGYLRSAYLKDFAFYNDESASNCLQAYIFCLNLRGYESRCKMVAEFYGWEE